MIVTVFGGFAVTYCTPGFPATGLGNVYVCWELITTWILNSAAPMSAVRPSSVAGTYVPHGSPVVSSVSHCAIPGPAAIAESSLDQYAATTELLCQMSGRNGLNSGMSAASLS